MEQRTYRGDIDIEGLADALVARFDHGDLVAQKVRGQDGHLMVQVATRERQWGAGRSALSIGIAPVEEGVRVTMGEQRWRGDGQPGSHRAGGADQPPLAPVARR